MLGKIIVLLLIVGLIFVTGYNTKIGDYLSQKNITVASLNISAPVGANVVTTQSNPLPVNDYIIEIVERSSKSPLFGVAVQIGDVRKYTDREGKVVFSLQDNNVDVIVESGWGADPIYKYESKYTLDKGSTNTIQVDGIGSFLAMNFISMRSIDYSERNGAVRVPRAYQGDWIFVVGTSSFIREPMLCINENINRLADRMVIAKNSGLLRVPDTLATRGIGAIANGTECFGFSLSSGMIQEHTTLFNIGFEFKDVVGSFEVYLKDNACVECKPTITTFIIG